jgi:glyoxylase-like metal-dependent hydrolase (beta-lactamase superfamily II)/predicted ester cyclase
MSTTAESKSGEVTEVAQRYFEAIARRDIDAMVACWSPGGIDRFVGQYDLDAPAGIREYFTGLFAAVPDMQFQVLSTAAEGELCAVRWRATGTFAGPGQLEGIDPTGARIEIEGCDVVQVRDGLIHHNDAYMNGVDLARQIGLLPPTGSKTEQRMNKLFNRRTSAAVKFAGSEAEPVADGVWLVRGGFPSKTMNVYLLEDEGGITVFDAGIESMTKAVAAAGARLGGIKRVVLGHGHADHRGAAPGLGVPVLCHPENRVDAESEDGGERYFDFSKLDAHARFLMPRLLTHWDGGPVQISGTVKEGDDVAGFQVIDLPGHAPGLIGLWRESDRLALVSDCFYTLDPQTGRKGHARVPHRAFNQDTEQARESIRKVAALEPAAAWAGHADPVRGDVRSQLEQAAATT